jgi:hypothetical protein
MNKYPNQPKGLAMSTTADAQHVREVFAAASEVARALRIKGAARIEKVRQVVSSLAPDLLHLVPAPAPTEPEAEDLVCMVRAWLDENGPRLPLLSEFRSAPDRFHGESLAGLDLQDDERGGFILSVDTFKSDVCQDADVRAVASALKAAGHLRHDPDTNTRQVRLPGLGDRLRVFNILPSIMEAV